MKDLTSKLLAEKYQAVTESFDEASTPPRGFERVTKVELETAHGHKPLKVYEMWIEGDILKVSVNVPTPEDEGQNAGAPTINPQMALAEQKPVGKPTPKPVPPQPTKKVPFKKNTLINKFKDKKGSFGDLGSRLG